MAITIKVGNQSDLPELPSFPAEPEPKPVQQKKSIKARRTLGGDIYLHDHEDIDIVLIPTKNKIITFPKKLMSDEVYASQCRLTDFLSKKGVIKTDSVHAGNIFNSLEAEIQKPLNDEIDGIQVALFTISKFLDTEKPYFIFKQEMNQREEERLTDPTEEESTELGEIPQEPVKGSVRPGLFNHYYGLANFWYE